MFHCSIASCKGDHPVSAIDACCMYSCIPPNCHLLHHVVALQHSGSGNPRIEEVSTEVPHMGKGEWMLSSWSCFCFNVTIYKGTWQMNPPMMFWFVFCCPFIDCLNNTFYWIKSYHHLGGNVGLTIIGFATIPGFVEGSILVFLMTKTWSRDRTWKPSCYDVNPWSLTKNKPGRLAISPHHWNSIFCKQLNWYWDSDGKLT